MEKKSEVIQAQTQETDSGLNGPVCLGIQMTLTLLWNPFLNDYSFMYCLVQIGRRPFAN